MSPLLVLSTALRAIATNKLRSSLTLLGVLIGVTAVIALMAIGQGAQDSITSGIANEGADVMFVRTAFFNRDAKELTLSDAEAISDRDLAPAVGLVSPESHPVFNTVRFGRESISAGVVGVTSNFLDANGHELASGRNIAPPDVSGATDVVLLGSRVAESLFGDADPIGQSVRISGRDFLVIGVLQSQGGNGFDDGQVYVPLTTAEARLVQSPTPGPDIALGQITVKAIDSDSVDQAKNQVEFLLRSQHEIAVNADSDFQITTNQGIVDTLEDTTDTLIVFLGIVGGISLFVGGIGIMNIMLVSVTERTREIGIRRAVGARRAAILFQFLTEATVLSLGGGLLGIAVGVAASQMLTDVELLGTRVDAQVSMGVAVLAMIVAASIGLVAGIYPAARAAILDPVDALRHE